MAPSPLGPFVLDVPLGVGGAGEVWRAVHAPTGTPVAIKLLRGDRLDARSLSVFRNEVRAVAALDHPAVVRVLEQDVLEEALGELPAGSPWLAMELADGTLAQQERMGWADARDALMALLAGLAHAHARGVVHRDVKPANVLRVGSSWKLADFGIAHALRAGADDAPIRAGTLAYTAPEQLLGRWRDEAGWTDLYAVGCLAWELVCGAPPFGYPGATALTDAHVHREPPPLIPAFPVPPGFEAWVRRLLEKVPTARYRFAAHAAAGLRALAEPTSGGVRGGSLSDTSTWVDDGTEVPPPGEPATVPVPQPSAPPWLLSRSEWLAGTGRGLYELRALPVVGREREQAALWSALAAVEARREPRVVVLTGPAGVGKSHLARWLGQSAHEAGAADVHRAVHHPRRGPLDGLAGLVRRAMRCAGLSADETRSRIASLLSGGDLPDGLTALLHPGTEHAVEPIAALWRLIDRVTRERPLVVWLDDVQWGAEALDLVRRLLDHPRRLPVLVVATARTEALRERPLEARQLHALTARPEVTTMPLAPLDSASGRQLVRELLGLSAGLAARVEERAAGNPLFAVRLVGSWVERDLLAPGPRGFVLRDHARVELPSDLLDLWEPRIALVAAAGRDALELAATLGQTVDLAEWEAVCARCGADTTGDVLEALQRRNLATAPRDGGWSFAHGMIAAAVERAASEAGRAPAWHRACATVLAERNAAPERRGRHLVAAGDLEQAVAPLVAGLTALFDRGEYTTALAVADEIEELMARLGRPPGDRQRLEALHQRGAVLQRMGERAAALDQAREVAVQARRIGDAPLLVRALVVMAWSGAPDRRLALEEAEQIAQTGGDASGLARVLRALAAVCLSEGRPADALALCERVDPSQLTAASRSLISLTRGLALRQLGDREAARASFEDAAEQARALGHRHAEACALVGLAEVEEELDDADAAWAHVERARRMLDGLLDRDLMAQLLNLLAELSRRRGDLEAAAARYQEARRTYPVEAGAWRAVPLLNLGLVRIDMDRPDEARAVLDQAISEFAAVGATGWLAAARAVRLWCVVADADFYAALDEVRDGLAASGFREPDVERALVRAADRARALGFEDRAVALEALRQD